MTTRTLPRPDTRSDNYADVHPMFTSRARLRAGDPARNRLRNKIVTRCLPLAEHIAYRFTGRGEPPDDLVQVARVGLLNAVDRYDVDRGADFVAFAVPTITGEVRRHFRDCGWTMRVPRRLQELHLAIGRTTGSLTQSLGRVPTTAEIAKELDADPAEVVDGLLVDGAYQPASIDAPVSTTREALPLVDLLGDTDADLDKVEDYAVIRSALDCLPERERVIVVLRFFGDLTQTQIAERTGLSQMHISRLLNRSLALMREHLDTEPDTQSPPP